jgi:hypothetical protein
VSRHIGTSGPVAYRGSGKITADDDDLDLGDNCL